MTITGGMIGIGYFGTFNKSFFSSLPRNFYCAFFCEILLVQSIACKVMKMIHKKV